MMKNLEVEKWHTARNVDITVTEHLFDMIAGDDNGVVASTSKSNIKANSVTSDLSMRKVVQYAAWVDSGDYVSGHGTHVAGSVAGARDEGVLG